MNQLVRKNKAIVGSPFHEKFFWWQNWVECGIHANCVPWCVPTTVRVDPSLEMRLSLRIRSKVIWVQNENIFTTIKKHNFLARGIFFVWSAFWDSVCKIVFVSQNIDLVMHFKMFLMKQHKQPMNVQLFSKTVKYGQSLNFMYGCHAGYQNGILWDVPTIIHFGDSIFSFHDFKDHV